MDFFPSLLSSEQSLILSQKCFFSDPLFDPINELYQSREDERKKERSEVRKKKVRESLRAFDNSL